MIDPSSTANTSINIGMLPIVRTGDAKPKFDLREYLIDTIWSGTSLDIRSEFEYLNYYFTAEDIKVFIDGLDLPDPDAEIPVMSMAFQVSQQKTPVYGMWSYTYDEMLRGNRIVSGAIRIATKSLNYMTRAVSKAAENRAKGKAHFPIRSLDVDEELIERYWGRHIEPNKAQDKNLFAIHPPFNFIIVYGINEASLCLPANINKIDDYVAARYNQSGSPLTNDPNHVIVEADQQDGTMRYVLEKVEITGMQVEYTPNGQVCSEVYTFVAKDVIIPSQIGDLPKAINSTDASETK